MMTSLNRPVPPIAAALAAALAVTLAALPATLGPRPAAAGPSVAAEAPAGPRDPAAAGAGIPAGDAVAAAAARAASYYADVVSVGGAYAWGYTPDLAMRHGKGGPVGPGTGLARPPGTPAVGAAFLRLHAATGDPRWLAAAGEAAHALAASQLASGGWGLTFETDPARRREWCYVADGTFGDACKALRGKDRNRSLLDDDITQSVVRFLLWYDEATGGRDAAVEGALDRALGKLSKAIRPNGACPLEMPVRDEADGAPRAVARIPSAWSRTWVKPGAAGPYYVLNDNLQRDCLLAFLVAERHAGDGRYLAVARRIGDFLLRAQLPEPHPGWAQSYDGDLQPVWGRTFEPPSVATAETAGAVDALLTLYAVTGDLSYSAAAQRGAAWLRDVRRPDGTWARFHELGTGRALFVDAGLNLTYAEDDLHEGYGFTGTFGIPRVLEQAVAAATARDGGPVPWWSDPAAGLSADALAARAAVLVDTQRPEGGWRVGDLVDSATFVEAMFVFSRLLEDGAAVR